jgi:hypothetical protein
MGSSRSAALLTSIAGARTGRVVSKEFCLEEKSAGRPESGLFRAKVLPSFGPGKPEDSLFLPRCGHASGSHFATGGGQNGEIVR